jgi:hypothetical protein
MNGIKKVRNSVLFYYFLAPIVQNEPDIRFHQVSYLNIEELNAIEPITPVTVSSTVTLEDIISSAKRKISEEYVDLRIPSPVLIQDSDTENTLGERKHLSGDSAWPKDVYNSDESSHKEDLSFVDHLVNSSEDEDDLWYNRNPPSIIEDGEQEDFEELLK